MENFVEWKLAWEIEVFWENVTQYHFLHHKLHINRPETEPGPPRSETSS
jgi:hypothetical protein